MHVCRYAVYVFIITFILRIQWMDGEVIWEIVEIEIDNYSELKMGK